MAICRPIIIYNQAIIYCAWKGGRLRKTCFVRYFSLGCLFIPLITLREWFWRGKVLWLHCGLLVPASPVIECKSRQSKTVCDYLKRSIWQHQRMALCNVLSVRERVMNSHLDNKQWSCQQTTAKNSVFYLYVPDTSNRVYCRNHHTFQSSGNWKKRRTVSLVNVIGQFNTMLGINQKRNLCTLTSLQIHNRGLIIAVCIAVTAQTHWENFAHSYINLGSRNTAEIPLFSFYIT